MTKTSPPELGFKPDEHTLALYHFDEGTGDVLKDSSGNGHHGKIVGAKWVKQESGQVSANDPMLEFPGGLEGAGKDAVHVDSLEYDPTKPFTLEAAFSWQYVERVTYQAIFAGRAGSGHTPESGARFGVGSHNHLVYRLGEVCFQVGDLIPREPTRVHLALVHTGQ